MTNAQDYWFTALITMVLSNVTDGAVSVVYWVLSMVFFVLWFIESRR